MLLLRSQNAEMLQWLAGLLVSEKTGNWGTQNGHEDEVHEANQKKSQKMLSTKG